MRHTALAGLLIALLALAAARPAGAYDYPHSPVGDVGCDYCHFVYLDQLLPDEVPHTPVDADDTVVNNLCRSCHNDLSAPYVQPHSSLTTSNNYGEWAMECTVCHKPHAKYERFGQCTSADATTLTAAGAGWSVDELKGLTLVPNVNQPDYRYPIVSNTAEVITVTGPIDLAQVQPGDQFGLFRNRLVLAEVSTPNSGIKAVKYFASTGTNSQADGDATFDGICEVCHTQTTHFRNDGTGADPLHENVEIGGVGGQECVRCHLHKNGFAHRGGRGGGCVACHGSSGAHGVHVAAVFEDCDRCHKQGDYPYFNSGTDGNSDTHIDLSETDVCEQCHNDGAGGIANVGGYRADWSVGALDIGCDGCHNGRAVLDFPNEMQTNGHQRLVGSAWIREYSCHYCHADSVDASWNLLSKHCNGTPDVVMDSKWAISGLPAPSYDDATDTCSNVYCHSDGTTVSPRVYDIAWTQTEHLGCNGCHGHPLGECTTCHTDGVPGWTDEDNWKSSMPMYANGGPGTETANTHNRHLMTEFSCENCHVDTVEGNCGDCHTGGIPEGTMGEVGHVDPVWHVNKEPDVRFPNPIGGYDKITKKCTTTDCHMGNDPLWGEDVGGQVICLSCHGTTGPDVNDYQAFNGTRGRINLTEWFDTGHGRAAASGNYDSGNPPADFPGNPCWYCHDFDVLHQEADNPYRLKMHPEFDAHFEKQCTFCHMEGKDYECMICHNDSTSLSPQLAAIASPPFSQDHTTYVDGQTTCLTGGCHPDDATQHNHGAGVWSPAMKEDILIQYRMMGVCLKCHDEDRFDVECQDPGGGGPVCTDCHDPDPRERCQECHAGPEYVLGYDPGTGLIEGVTRASTSHFGYKHYKAYSDSLDVALDSGTASETAVLTTELKDVSKVWTVDQWAGYSVRMMGGANLGEVRIIASNSADTLTLDKGFETPVAVSDAYTLVDPVLKGGKFCWDCHDPHGDGNVFLIHDEVSLETDGTFGIPKAQAAVTFTNVQSGLDYARTAAPYDGICNVCHTDTEHYTATTGDGHMAGRICTNCHSHQFGTSHASGKTCGSCHNAKPLTRHDGLGQPRDCTQCHEGAIKLRMDIMGQMRANSHHVQGVEVTNTHCYACHWESTPEGLIDPTYHEGFNNETHVAIPNEKVDLVIWGPGTRPTVPEEGALPDVYEPGDTLVRFTANKIGTAEERIEVAKVSQHCLSCHSDQNNDTDPFNDCKTPRQYAWDRSSIAARYSNTDRTTWGKYTDNYDGARKWTYKAYSAHGNAVDNFGGYSTVSGLDGPITNTRNGTEAVQCFDCHSSHGSKTEGTTSSYTTFNDTYNGANLKETQAGKGGYGVTYRAQEVVGGVNPMKAGAAQCFDCHETHTAGALPWGYNSTYGATQPIVGYKDTPRFDNGTKPSTARYSYRPTTMAGGHLKASSPLVNNALYPINGLCAGCHDPHGVSPSLGADMEYSVPLLKGTWLTSPYKEDAPTEYWGVDAYYAAHIEVEPPLNYHIDQDTFGAGGMITETEEKFAGLCLRCHPKSSLTDGTNKNTPWMSLDRVHETVKGWGNNQAHNYPCSKCHQAHVSALPRLMTSNCLDVEHLGLVDQGGSWPPYVGGHRQFVIGYGGKPPQGWRDVRLSYCHDDSAAQGGTWSHSTGWNPVVQQWNSVTQWP